MLKKINGILAGMILYHTILGAQEHIIADSPCQSSLDDLGRRYQTDKAYSHHYTSLYDECLVKFRDKPITFLEIGFDYGASARMWDAYFTHEKTNLHFIDINQDTYNYTHGLSKRCTLHIVNQESEKELIDFVNTIGGDFDIILDDGGHTMNQQITTFKTLFPYLKVGGLFIIEDLHTSYWQSHGSAGTPDNPKASEHSTINFLKSLVDDLNYSGARTTCAHKDNLDEKLLNSFNYFQKHIDSIHFYSSLCIIKKR